MKLKFLFVVLLVGVVLSGCYCMDFNLFEVKC